MEFSSNVEIVGINMENKTSLSNFGQVVSVRGSVVDMQFNAHLPLINTVLRAGVEGRIIIEVLAQKVAI